MVQKPKSDHSIKPSFDEATAKLYCPTAQTINFQRPTHASTLQVHITSTLKGKGTTHIPTRATPDSIGYDLKSPKATSIPPPQGRKAVPLGIAIAIPTGLYGRIAPRSGMALHQHIDVAGGVIDPDYRGEVKVILVNNSQKRFNISPGDTIAQMIFEYAATPAIHLLSHLSITVRDKGGFGNTDSDNTKQPINTETTPMARPINGTIPNIIPDDTSIEPPPTQTVERQPAQTSTPPPQSHIIPDDTTKDTQQAPQTHSPPSVHPVDKPRSGEPQTKTITEDELRRSIGFQAVDRITPHLKTCFKDNFHLSSLDREPVIDICEISTIDRPRISTNSVCLPANLGDTLHIDIGYGCSAGIAGIKYALFVVDRATRNKYIYGLTSLKHDILPAIKQLVTDIGRNPGKIVADYDHKLMGRKVTEYLNEINCRVESAPPKHQYQNGLVERNWRSVVKMARSWLNSSLLPSSFWFHAIKRAVEVSNYLPVKL